MEPLTLDLSVYRRFGFTSPPVGVKFLFDKPEGLPRLDKQVPFCGMVGEAQRRGTSFYIDIDNHGCPPGTYAVGRELPKIVEGGNLGPELRIFKGAYANQRALAAAPTFPKDTVNYVVFAPLDELSFTPDLFIILTDTTSQAEIVLRALSYTTGMVLNSRMTNVLGCAWLYVYPYLSGQVNYLTTGIGFGMKAQKVFPEGKQLISIPYDWLPVITMNLEEMEWVPPSYSDDDPEFSKRTFAKFGF
ncbi:MAG: DUF169 domain-containing protein [Thermoleophilia bacterium]|nr:DUF169 domain-containing protein [Thermoleophilia bacterium]